jgi:hypothetical protein
LTHNIRVTFYGHADALMTKHAFVMILILADPNLVTHVRSKGKKMTEEQFDALKGWLDLRFDIQLAMQQNPIKATQLKYLQRELDDCDSRIKGKLRALGAMT